MTTATFTADIPREAAYRAHAGTSFVPDRRADQERDDYAATLTGDYDRLAKYADTPEKQATLNEEFARYRAGYRRYTLEWLGSRAGIMSTMIAGPSNFPTRRMEKRNASEQRRRERLITYRERALKAIEKKLRPELRPVMAGDSDAVERLQEKIAKAEAWQEGMKAANKIVRSKKLTASEKTAQIAARLEISEATAAKLLEPDFCGRLGFPAYELQNNNANIARMKQRLATISRDQEQDAAEVEGAHATIEDSPADNRVRLFFPGKPSAEVRSTLKGAGFRWAPSLGCWQAYRNHRSQEIARSVAGVQ